METSAGREEAGEFIFSSIESMRNGNKNKNKNIEKKEENSSIESMRNGNHKLSFRLISSPVVQSNL